MRKFQAFFLRIANLRQELITVTPMVKEAIGDSTNNNRTLTVNQVIRYLRVSPVKGNKKLVKQLTSVYDILREDIVSDRRQATRRTDAVDFNEFVTTYRSVVMDDRKKRLTIGKVL